MQQPPRIDSSTPEERMEYLRNKFVCIGNCDLCGICASFHGKRPELVLQDYLEGRMEFREALKKSRG